MEAYKEIIELLNLPVRYFITTTKNKGKICAHPHWHNAIEIIYVKKGKATQQIDKNIFPVSDNDIIIIWHDQIHSTYSLENVECEMSVLQFMIDDASHIDKTLNFFTNLTIENPLYNDIKKIISDIINELKMNDEAVFHIIKAKIHLIYALIIRNAADLPLNINTTKHKRDTIIQIFNYIDNNYKKAEISLKTASEYVHLSVPQFMRVFKAATGMTFKYYLNLYRINQSVTYLCNNETVTKTSEECGFDNINTYIRLFKKYKNTTPSKYQNSKFQLK